MIIFGGTALGLVGLVRAKRHARANYESIPRFTSRFAGLALLAGGTVVLSFSGALNSALGEMRAFSVTLTVGVTLLFTGFALSSLRARSDAGWLSADA